MRRRYYRRATLAELIRESEATRQVVDALPDEELRARHARGWLLAGIFAALMCGTVVLAPVGIAALVITWWGHRARYRRRAAAVLAARPPIDPAAELEFAREWGLPTGPWEEVSQSGTPGSGPHARGRHSR